VVAPVLVAKCGLTGEPVVLVTCTVSRSSTSPMASSPEPSDPAIAVIRIVSGGGVTTAPTRQTTAGASSTGTSSARTVRVRSSRRRGCQARSKSTALTVAAAITHSGTVRSK
jgi:hypothetical protein